MLTQEDYKKIQQWLTNKSVKDTEFNESTMPFKGNEIITIVQDNQNKKVFLKDLVSQIFNLGVSDFINVSEKYDAYIIDLEEAIRLIPSRARKVGQVITFLNKENLWQIYQFKGALNQWNVLDQWEDLFASVTIDSILPDEEDLTKSLPDENGNSYLSLKDREYNPEDFSGLGKVILRKNIVEVEDPIYGKVKKNVLYQDMINKENTIYEIRYNFDLNGEEITIPEGCVLDFQGGSLSNGSIIGNNTTILGYKNCFKNVFIKGTYLNEKVNSDWVNFNNSNNLNKLQNGLNLCNGEQYTIFNIIDGNYEIECKGVNSEIHYTDGGLTVPGNTTFNLNGNSLICIPNDGEGYSMITISNDNVTLCNGYLIGDVETHIGESGEFGYGVQIIGSQNIIIKDINSSYFWGDGIIITAKINGQGPEADLKLCKNLTIERCICSNNRRQGISVISCKNLNIYNSKFIDTGAIKKTAPGAGIDLEQNWYLNEIIDDVYIEGCIFTGNSKGICINDKLSLDINRTFNIYITNCSFGKTCQFRTKEGSNITFDNCSFDGWIQFTDGNINFKDCVFYGHFELLPPNGSIARNSNYIFNNCNLYINTYYGNNAFVHVTDGIIGKENFLFKNTNFHSELNVNGVQNVVYGNSLNNIEINYIGCKFLEPYFTGVAIYFAWNILFTNYIVDCSGYSVVSIILQSNNKDTKIIKNNSFSFHRRNNNRDTPYFIFNGNYITEKIRDILILDNNIHIDSISTPLWNNAMVDNNLSVKPKVSFSNNHNQFLNDLTRDEYSYIVNVGADQTQNLPSLIIKKDISINSDGYKGCIGISILKNKMLFHNGNNWVDCNGMIPGNNSGKSSNRPACGNSDIGYCYFDTTLGKPIYWTGTKWVDATGAEV